MFPVEQSKKNIYTAATRNIWHLSHEGGRARGSCKRAERSDVAVGRFSGRKLRTKAEEGSKSDLNPATAPVAVNGTKLGPHRSAQHAE